MNKDTRLSDVLHVLLHMDQMDEPLTSEVLARAMGTNPAVFRRTMAGMRKAGFVQSEKGHGGGWRLVKPLDDITLLAVYNALGCPNLFSIGNRSRNADCLVEKKVNAIMEGTLAEATALLAQRFGEITLDKIAPSARASMNAHRDAQGEDTGSC